MALTLELKNVASPAYHREHPELAPMLEAIRAKGRDYGQYMNGVIDAFRDAAGGSRPILGRGAQPVPVGSRSHEDYQQFRTLTVFDPSDSENPNPGKFTFIINSVVENDSNTDEFFVLVDTFVIDPDTHGVVSSSVVETKQKQTDGSYMTVDPATTALKDIAPHIQDWAAARLVTDASRFAVVRQYVLPVADLMSTELDLGSTPEAISAAITLYVDDNITMDPNSRYFTGDIGSIIERAGATMCEEPAPVVASACAPSQVVVCSDPVELDVLIMTDLVPLMSEIAALPTRDERQARMDEVNQAMQIVLYQLSSVAVQTEGAYTLLNERFAQLTGVPYDLAYDDTFYADEAVRTWGVVAAAVPPTSLQPPAPTVYGLAPFTPPVAGNVPAEGFTLALEAGQTLPVDTVVTLTKMENGAAGSTIALQVHNGTQLIIPGGTTLEAGATYRVSYQVAPGGTASVYFNNASGNPVEFTPSTPAVVGQPAASPQPAAAPGSFTVNPATLSPGPFPGLTVTSGAGPFPDGAKIQVMIMGNPNHTIEQTVSGAATQAVVIPADAGKAISAGLPVIIRWQAPGEANWQSIQTLTP